MRKTITAIIMVLTLLFVPQTALCAEASLSPNVIAESYSTDSKSISGGDTFKLSFRLRNTSKNLDIENVLIRLSGGEAFIVNNSTDTIYADSIGKNSAASFSKEFYCREGAPQGVYPITANISYEYYDGGEKQSASAECNMTVTVLPSRPQSEPHLTPQLLISEFSYGGASIEGGASFNLKFGVKNNSADIDVKNVVIKISGGEAFVVADGSDTIAIKQISKNSAAGVEKSFKCLSAVPTGIYTASALISFEYFENGQKQSGSSELTMSIPVVQPDRLRFESISLADKTITVNQENDCAFKLINSGQTRLLNGTVRLLEGESEAAAAYIGNIEPGGVFESNYTLPIKPSETGTKKLTLIFEYENENAEKKSISQEFSVTAEEEHDPFEGVNKESDVTYEDDGSSSKIAIACIAAGIILIIAIPVTVKIVKKKKARKGSEAFDEEI